MAISSLWVIQQKKRFIMPEQKLPLLRGVQTVFKRTKKWRETSHYVVMCNYTKSQTLKHRRFRIIMLEKINLQSRVDCVLKKSQNSPGCKRCLQTVSSCIIWADCSFIFCSKQKLKKKDILLNLCTSHTFTPILGLHLTSHKIFTHISHLIIFF